MNDYLKHYGILGMKRGVRRFQNKDGSLTPEGKRRYRATSSDSATTKKVKKRSGSKIRKFLEKQAQNNANRYMKKANKKEDIRNQKLQKKAAELVTKYGDKYKVEVYLKSIDDLVKLQGYMDDEYSAYVDVHRSAFELMIMMGIPFEFCYNSKGEIIFDIGV